MGKEKGRWSERRGRKEEVKETLSLGKFLRASMLQQRRRERSRQVERKKTKVKGLVHDCFEHLATYTVGISLKELGVRC